MKIHLICAARPNFMKIAPLYHALKKAALGPARDRPHRPALRSQHVRCLLRGPRPARARHQPRCPQRLSRPADRQGHDRLRRASHGTEARPRRGRRRCELDHGRNPRRHQSRLPRSQFPVPSTQYPNYPVDSVDRWWPTWRPACGPSTGRCPKSSTGWSPTSWPISSGRHRRDADENLHPGRNCTGEDPDGWATS